MQGSIRGDAVVEVSLVGLLELESLGCQAALAACRHSPSIWRDSSVHSYTKGPGKQHQLNAMAGQQLGTVLGIDLELHGQCRRATRMPCPKAERKVLCFGGLEAGPLVSVGQQL